ncbi:calcium:proton antiporter [Leucobacter luti]|uniref:calcium:proton antiporter n=1 Tax=Leucobacter luti TaxID=340320 RepID=UPI003D00614F
MTSSTPATSIRSILGPAALIRLIIPWAGVVALVLLHDVLAGPLSGPVLGIALASIIVVILIAAFGVVEQAEQLAHRLGDPYGSLVLTLSIVIIEVVLIAAVMLGPGEHATIARDSVSAVSLIIMGFVLGLSMLVGGRRGGLAHNRVGTSQYVAMIGILSVLAFVLPAVAGADGSLRPAQIVPVAGLTAVVYVFFLWRQLGAQAGDFREVRAIATATATASASVGSSSGAGARAAGAPQADAEERTPVGEVLREHRSEILTRILLLVATMVPIVLLSHDLATFLDDGIARIGAPTALSGALIASIVFAPEAITSVRAARGGEIQRVINLCLGALVSTVGLTIPAVLAIGAITGSPVLLAETPAMLAILIATIGLTAVTTAAPKLTSTHGAMHLAVFAVYGILLFTT